MLTFKIKVKVCTFDIAPLRESSSQKCSGMALVLNGSHSFTCTPTRSSAIGMTAFPAIADTHLPTPEGWKAELAWVAGYVVTVNLPEGSHPSHY